MNVAPQEIRHQAAVIRSARWWAADSILPLSGGLDASDAPGLDRAQRHFPADFSFFGSGCSFL
jgi:hypothetical protein